MCLGAVIEGDTDHYEHVAHRASEGLMRVQLDTGVPVAFGDPDGPKTRRMPYREKRARGAPTRGESQLVAAVMAANVLRQHRRLSR